MIKDIVLDPLAICCVQKWTWLDRLGWRAAVPLETLVRAAVECRSEIKTTSLRLGVLRLEGARLAPRPLRGLDKAALQK